MVDLYGRCRHPMGGYSCLPDAGGLNDQCAWLMDAFAIVQAAADELNRGKQ